MMTSPKPKLTELLDWIDSHLVYCFSLIRNKYFHIFVPIINLVNVITTPNIEVPSSFQYVQPFFFSGAIYRDLTPELALGKDEIC